MSIGYYDGGCDDDLDKMATPRCTEVTDVFCELIF